METTPRLNLPRLYESLERLPPEITTNILRDLPPVTFGALSDANRFLRNLSGTSSLLRHQLQKTGLPDTFEATDPRRVLHKEVRIQQNIRNKKIRCKPEPRPYALKVESACTLSADGRQLCGRSRLDSPAFGSQVHLVCDAKTRDKVYSLPLQDETPHFSFAIDTPQFLAFSARDSLKLWNLHQLDQGPQTFGAFSRHACIAAALAPGGRHLVALTEDGAMHLWSKGGGFAQQHLEIDLAENKPHLWFSWDGKTLYARQEKIGDPTLSRWSVAPSLLTSEPNQSVKLLGPQQIYSTRPAPNGRFLLIRWLNQAKQMVHSIYDLEERQPRLDLLSRFGDRWQGTFELFVNQHYLLFPALNATVLCDLRTVPFKKNPSDGSFYYSAAAAERIGQLLPKGQTSVTADGRSLLISRGPNYMDQNHLRFFLDNT